MLLCRLRAGTANTSAAWCGCCAMLSSFVLKRDPPGVDAGEGVLAPDHGGDVDRCQRLRIPAWVFIRRARQVVFPNAISRPRQCTVARNILTPSYPGLRSSGLSCAAYSRGEYVRWWRCKDRSAGVAGQRSNTSPARITTNRQFHFRSGRLAGRVHTTTVACRPARPTGGRGVQFGMFVRPMEVGRVPRSNINFMLNQPQMYPSTRRNRQRQRGIQAISIGA